MKKTLAYLLVPIFLASAFVLAEDKKDAGGHAAAPAQHEQAAPAPAQHTQAPTPVQHAQAPAPVQHAQAAAPHAPPQRRANPVVINIEKPSSGTHNRNFNTAPAEQLFTHNPSYQHRPKSVAGTQGAQPAGQSFQTAHQQNLIGTPQAAGADAAQPHAAHQGNVQQPQAIGSETVGGGGTQPAQLGQNPHHYAATVAHQQRYQNATQPTLMAAGVTAEPAYIANREEIVDTDREHSKIDYPKTGPDQKPLMAKGIASNQFSSPVVRNHMQHVNDPTFMNQLRETSHQEKDPNHYYWHQGQGFNYVHYTDANNYHWYGWYLGDQFFWTRRFKGRWWLYDSNANRWNFWNDGYWWWQDPAHVGELYYDNDGEYIPSDAEEGDVAVSQPEPTQSSTVFTSPDNTRVVKVFGDAQDAFLYDATVPPSFDPIYLASKVQSVQFSDPNNGRPLQIILSLSDGSFDMFDENGNTYNPRQVIENQMVGPQPQTVEPQQEMQGSQPLQ